MSAKEFSSSSCFYNNFFHLQIFASPGPAEEYTGRKWVGEIPLLLMLNSFINCPPPLLSSSPVPKSTPELQCWYLSFLETSPLHLTHNTTAWMHTSSQYLGRSQRGSHMPLCTSVGPHYTCVAGSCQMCKKQSHSCWCCRMQMSSEPWHPVKYNFC